MKYTYVCPGCGESFESRYRSRKFCSRSCSTTAQNAARTDATKQKIAATIKARWESNRGDMLAGLARRNPENGRIAVKRLHKNPEFRRKLDAARLAAGYPKDPLVPLRNKMRTAIKNSLRRCILKKHLTAYATLGYRAEDLRRHIESLFAPGMTWDNYGRWEIDHKRPIASFSVDTPLRIINALTNLQPLWKPENRKKRDSWPHTVQFVTSGY